MTKQEQIRAACGAALARVGLCSPGAAREGTTEVSPDIFAALCYALAGCLRDLRAKTPLALDDIADGVILQLAVKCLWQADDADGPTQDGWAQQAIMGRIGNMLRDHPGVFGRADDGRRSVGDVCDKMPGIIRGGNSDAVREWLALSGAKVAGLPRRFDAYVRTLAAERIDPPPPEPLPDDDHDRRLEDVGLEAALTRLLAAQDLQAALRFVDLVVTPRWREWLAGYPAMRPKTNYDYVRKCELSDLLYAAWLIWRAPALARDVPEEVEEVIVELMRVAYAKVRDPKSGGSEVFTWLKKAWESAWLAPLLARAVQRPARTTV